MNWAVGLTTIPDRRETTLPRTIASLKLGGFDCPRLFVDNCQDDDHSFGIDFNNHMTKRWPRIRPWGNFILGLYELYIRSPLSDLFAMFQDDVVCYRNLRQYLEQRQCPDKGYMNLATYPSNQKIVRESGDAKGWFQSNQLGKGAWGLVFTNAGVRALLSSNHATGRPMDLNRGWRAIDGGVVDGMKEKGFAEYCHNPSLIQHIGSDSSLHHLMNQVMRDEPEVNWRKCHPASQPPAESFRGEEFNALDLL